MTVTDLLSWASITLGLLVFLTIAAVVFAWRRRRQERVQRSRQLNSVYNARDHRERGD